MPNSLLFQPYEFRNHTARNRVWISPMCQFSVDEQDGKVTDWHLVHLGAFATGGAGLIVVEATAVVPEGRISPWDLGIWSDEHIAPLRRITDFLHQQGALAGIQLAHAGRKASTSRPWAHEQRISVDIADGGWQPVAPSAISVDGFNEPRALTAEEIEVIPDAFVAAALRAKAAGFDLLEIHAAHGYLLHEFLSPLSNTRGDDWNGSLENRARLTRNVVRAVVAAVPDLDVIVRFSATDWAEGGWNEDETAIVAKWVIEDGAQLVDISTGGLISDVTIPIGPGYQVPFAASVRAAAGVPTASVGIITDAAQAEQILQDGAADAVFVGREALRDPHVANRWAFELGAEPHLPPQYLRAPFRRRA